ncbi:MAG: CDP-diacylglycerol--glycerol-3-phosphate 3-phosphatidyltransferase [Lachnospiraceae bacterium]|jgi:CDP-diacylglycerol--glycerol-3-phosphate 3-phosphatidyltransferase|nr:CDP-diacylglycerol--glycerol-3-phosphate 3-phosphatidyltransferase [Lachnospiraceae bacterium]MCI1726657.1 CDP-diacylglycerol--glycerol-3-phosphate 3-phosphatidyltransferase [Lachnospiraceae bacterium]
MNTPNKLTVMRMILVVPFVILMLAGRCEGWTRWAALAIFIAASLTDTLDGYLARKYHLITNFGKFMDPLADKLLVCAALICLVDIGRLYAIVCIIIISREFIISGFRLVAADTGKVIAANIWGKAKTVSQMVMIILLIIGFTDPFLHTLTEVIVWISTALTVISLITYILQNQGVLSAKE